MMSSPTPFALLLACVPLKQQQLAPLALEYVPRISCVLLLKLVMDLPAHDPCIFVKHIWTDFSEHDVLLTAAAAGPLKDTLEK